MSDIVVYYDLETTGLNPLFDDIIEIGAISCTSTGTGTSEEEFHCLIRTSLYNGLPPQIERITGITDALLLKEGLEKSVALPNFNAWLRRLLEKLEQHEQHEQQPSGHLYLIAHNGDNFDHTFIRRLLYQQCASDSIFNKKARIRFADSRTFVQYLCPGIQLTNLGYLCTQSGIRYEGAHRATQDAKFCRDVLMHFIQKYGMSEFVKPSHESHEPHEPHESEESASKRRRLDSVLWNKLYRNVYRFSK